MAGGFAWFAHGALRTPPRPAQAPQADGLVVLTGGAGRIEAAMTLLIGGHARLLLISGVRPGVDLAELMPPSLALNRAALARLAPRITLGHTATDTVGNARETAAWARMNDLHSLVVVTAAYHLQRALSEIGRALPDVRLTGWPVTPPALQRPLSLHGWWLLAREYAKFLVVSAGLRGTHLREMG
nr:YdcF family protein [Endobacter medicaginis]